MTHSCRQRFIDDQVVEVFLDGRWQRGIVDAGDGASPRGDYQFAGSYDVAVWVRGEMYWVRNDRRRIRPVEGLRA